MTRHSLAPEHLRWRCDPRRLGGPSTARIPPDDTWFGEERVREAVLLSLRIRSPHHHLLLRGTAGTNLRALLEQSLGEMARRPRRDLVYVERFHRPAHPRLLILGPGEGQEFVENLDAIASVAESLGGLGQMDALARVRAALAQIRANTHGREARNHLTALRKRLLADLPVLRTGARGASIELYRGKLLFAAAAAPPVVEMSRVDARALFGATDGHDEAPSVARLAPGALVEADGGVCIVPAEPLLAHPALVRRLVATLRSDTLHLAPSQESPGALFDDYRPDPIPLNTRVVVLGVRTARMAPLREAEALRVFGVLADCAGQVPWTEDAGAHLARLVSHTCREEGLLHARAAAIARLIEEQVRDAEGKSKISCRTGLLADRLREADLAARAAGSPFIEAHHVVEALAHRCWRSARAEENHRERLASQRLRVRTEGTAVGTVNGLLVYTLDGHSYGAPSRITATTAVGREGVINIEREAKLSGGTFDKGVYTLVGNLRSRFCQRDPLGMVAMITCEQSHGRIDGDSASAAELVAILSSLAGVPVQQGVAITGSVGQRGELLSVGSVNEKIEGFFATCRDRGLQAGQGVIISRTNVEDLVLHEELVAAATQGHFQVWAVDTVEDALELLTGLPAGKLDRSGSYPPKSVLGRAQRRLEQMSNRLFPPRKDSEAKRPS